MQEFSKATRRPKPTEEPEGLEQFAAGAANVRLVPSAPPSFAEEPVAAPPAVPPEITYPPHPARASLVEPRLRMREPVFAMSVRFDPWEKDVLEKLSALEDRSQHQILKRLLRPVLEQVAKTLK